MSDSTSKPSAMPPEASVTQSADEQQRPDDVLQEVSSQEESSATAPTQSPPETASSSGDDAFGAGTWYNNKKITSLWTTNQQRNSYAGVSGLGWRKIAGTSDSAVVALTAAAAHARDRDRAVNVKIDNNQIVELYVW